MKMDFVFVRDLAVRTISGVDAWKRPQSQPLLVSIFINSNFRQASQSDHLSQSLNYDVISRTITAKVEAAKFKSLDHVAESISKIVLSGCPSGDWARIHVKKPRSLLRAESAEIVVSRKNTPQKKADLMPNIQDLVKINNLRLVTIIGVNTIERVHRQNVSIDITMYKPLHPTADTAKIYEPATVSEIVASHVEAASYKTLEAFTESIAHVICSLGIEKVKVVAGKPSALTWAEMAGIEIVRTKNDFDAPIELHQPSQPGDTLFPQTEVDTSKPIHNVYIAFGTNIGDQWANIQRAADLLNSNGVKVLRTSSIYKSKPMYVKEQDEFYNGVFACETELSPNDLLKTLKHIEYSDFARVKLVNNGPRPMDLDILLYDDAVINQPDLNIPHIDMLNRTFVLQPLIDVAPADMLHPLTAEPFLNHLDQVPKESDNQVSSALVQVIPCGGSLELVLDPRNHSMSTQIMAIMNNTPNSFSDGGDLKPENFRDVALRHVKDGATILDVGGLSTRPGSEPCTTDEEIDRVVSVIKELREESSLDGTIISVDTYRSEVAKAALEAGANIINDVFSGQKDPQIFDVAAKYKAPIILSHSRGDPKTMNSLAKYENLIEEVGKELEKLVDQAISAGVQRWQIILDPGIGFAKTLEQNLELIRNFSSLRSFATLQGFPWLVGTSRKKFIGTLTGNDEPKDRAIGSAATVSALIEKGADIVRVHDTAVTRDTVRVADAIYRNIK